MSWLYYVEGFSSSVCKLFLNPPVFRTALLPSDAPRGPDPASLQSTLFSLLLMGEGGGGRYLGILLLLKPSFCSSFCCHLHHHLHRQRYLVTFRGSAVQLLPLPAKISAFSALVSLLSNARLLSTSKLYVWCSYSLCP